MNLRTETIKNKYINKCFHENLYFQPIENGLSSIGDDLITNPNSTINLMFETYQSMRIKTDHIVNNTILYLTNPILAKAYSFNPLLFEYKQQIINPHWKLSST